MGDGSVLDYGNRRDPDTALGQAILSVYADYAWLPPRSR